MLKLFNYEEVKDIQETYIKTTENKDDIIKILANRYSVDESMINRVLEGDKNITSYAQIKSVKSKGVSIKNKSITDITKEAIEDFNKSDVSTEEIDEDKKEDNEIPLEEEKPKRKCGWQKGRPRGKKSNKEKKEENNTLTELNEIIDIKNFNKEEYDIIIGSLKMRMEDINKKIILLEKEMDSIHSIIKKLEKNK